MNIKRVMTEDKNVHSCNKRFNLLLPTF